MKKKKLIKIFSIATVLVVLVIFSLYLTPKTIKQDNATLALTIDGKTSANFPDYDTNKYSVDVTCENALGRWLNIDNEWKFVVENLSGNAICNLDFTSNPTTLKAEVQSKANTNSNGYRYSGKKTNNYVLFNNELWRIIGNVPTCTSSGCSSSENLVKIIRAQSIGNYNYGVSGYIEWHKSDGAGSHTSLYVLLNQYYLGKLNATGLTYCQSTDDGSDKPTGECDFRATGIDASGYYGSMIKNVYWNTGKAAGNVTASEYYNYEVKDQTSYSYIGLMNISDYAYAADSTYHNLATSGYNTAAITGTNWLYANGKEWTITPTSSYADCIYSINYNGSTSNSNYITTGYPIRPVVYLDASVYVVDGTGTQDDPYIIGI